MKRIQKVITMLIGLLLTISTAFVTVGSAQASTIHASNDIIISEDELSAKFEQGFETIFSKILMKDDSGAWKTVPGYQKYYPDISIETSTEMANNLNKLAEKDSGLQGRNLKDFGVCVLKGIIPGAGLLDINWGQVVNWIKHQTWGKLSKYLAKHAAKIGFKDMAKLSPWGLASSVVLSAVSCAIWG